MLKKHVVVVGGGWAGIRLARKLKKLAKQDKIRITLVSNEPNFRYSAALYRVATGHKEKQAIIPIHELVKDIPNIRHIRATMSAINQAERTISLGNHDVLHYDYAVIAIGAVTTYFDIPGIEEHAYSIKTERELRKFRTHLHQELLEEHAPDKNYIIVGAGPTGVELSAALASYMKVVMRRHKLRRRRVHITLVEAAPRILPASHKRAAKLAHKHLRELGITIRTKAKVEKATASTITINGVDIPTKTIVWTAGVANNPFFSKKTGQFILNNRGKVVVDDHLRVSDRIYVIGDNAVTPYSGLGLTAVHNAAYVARDIERRLNKPRHYTAAYRPLVPATVVPVGKNWAVFQYRSTVFGGRLGNMMRSLADLTAYRDIAGSRKALSLWAHSEDLEERCVLCKTALADEDAII